MISRSTLAGLLVLGLLAVGVYWARSSRSTAPVSAELPPPAAVQAVADDDRVPDATLRDTSARIGNLAVVLSLSPRPPVAFATTRVRLAAFAVAEDEPRGRAASPSGAPLALSDVHISFEMTMPMGDHRPTLRPGPDGWYEGEVVLPLCASGKRRWYATVEGTTAGRPFAARFRLDLSPPSGLAPPGGRG